MISLEALFTAIHFWLLNGTGKHDRQEKLQIGLIHYTACTHGALIVLEVSDACFYFSTPASWDYLNVLNYSTKLRYKSRDGPVIWFLGSFDSLNGQKLIVPTLKIFNLGDGRRDQSPYLSGYHRSVCVCVTLSAVNATCLTNVSKLPHVSRSSIVFLLQFCRTLVALLSHFCCTHHKQQNCKTNTMSNPPEMSTCLAARVFPRAIVDLSKMTHQSSIQFSPERRPTTMLPLNSPASSDE